MRTQTKQRICNRCGEPKPTDQFFASNPYRCKLCIKEQVQEWRCENRDRHNAHARGLLRGDRIRDKLAVERQLEEQEQKKQCKRCGKWKKFKFFRESPRGRHGLHSWCAKCLTAANQNWNEQNKDRQRDAFLRRKFGISFQTYSKMLSEQGGGCAICGGRGAGEGRYSLCVDHDHKTGEVRGLLCTSCNVAIGHLKDSTKRMRAAIRYLNFYRKGG